MANISSIQVGSTSYDVKDATARALLSDIGLSTSAGTISSSVLPQHAGAATSSNGLYKITVDSTGTVTSSVAATKQDILDLGLTSITYSLGWNDATNQLVLTPSEGTGSTITIGMASSVNGHSVESNVPADAVFTDTTYGVATTSANGLMSAADKTQLNNLQSSYDNLVEDAPAAYDTLKEISDYISQHQTEYQALNTLAGKQSDWGVTDTTAKEYIKNKPGLASASANGFMSSGDFSKLSGVEANANNYSHPTYTNAANGLYKVTVDGTGHVSGTSAVAKSDITALGIPGSDTTYAAATASADGLMTSTMVSKLAGVAENANNYSHPTHTAYTSGFYKVTINNLGHVTAATPVTKEDITALIGSPSVQTIDGVETLVLN